MGDQKNDRLLCQPIRVADAPFSDSKQNGAEHHIKVLFPAPPNPGKFPFRVTIVSDTYIGNFTTRSLEVSLAFNSLPDTDDDTSWKSRKRQKSQRSLKMTYLNPMKIR